MDEGDKRTELKIITVIVLLGILAAIYIIGVPVPACRPYVEPQIWLERDSYHVGESVPAKLVLENRMPFPVHIVLTEGVSYEIYMEKVPDEVGKGHFAGPKSHPEGIRIGFNEAAWSDQGMSQGTYRTGNLTFTFTVENMTIRKTVTIIE